VKGRHKDGNGDSGILTFEAKECGKTVKMSDVMKFIDILFVPGSFSSRGTE